MITTLSVQFPEPAEGIRKLWNKCKRDKLTVEIRRARGVSVRRLSYLCYSGTVNLSRADALIGEERSRLLCSEQLIFPKNSGYRRFTSHAFPARLCTNMALAVLSSCENAAQLRLGVYDPSGVATDFVLHALDFCARPVIVTRNTEFYGLAQDRALEEWGAAFTVTQNADILGDCDLLIAPSVIEESLPLRETAVTLTVAPPRAELKGSVYDRYHFRMPNGFDTLRPAELDEAYFCSALYTLGAQYALGSLVPLSCSGGNRSQTVPSLAALLEHRQSPDTV